MTGKLYVIGVGPGDPELLTLKAVRILKEVQCICVPKGSEEGSSLALSIVERVINIGGKEIIEAHFPMQKTRETQESGVCELDTKWNEIVKNILSRLNKGIDMAFITIGDPAIYSTFFYLYDKLLELSPGLNIEIIPGVSSINASASRAGISLGIADERITILPANYSDDLKETIDKFNTIVLMKVHKVFNNILKTLNEMNLLKNAVYVSKAGMEDERVFKNIMDVKPEDLNYFSMVIIRK
jgi:precorrin-2/cobalt-factor-2 C20-methyltransferase